MGDVYGQFEFAPKSAIRGGDMGKGQVSLPHIAPALFLELKNIKLHNHNDVDSVRLRADSTPEMVKGMKTREREERGLATWTGSAVVGGALNLEFATAFNEVPTVHPSIAMADDRLICSYGNATKEGCTIYWRNVMGVSMTSVTFSYLVKGR